MADQSTTGNASSTTRITDKAHWLTFSQWLYDDVSKAYTATGLQAVTLLGFDGVILSLARGDQSIALTCASKYLVFTGILAVIVSAIACVIAMIPRQLGLVNYKTVQIEWSRFLKSGDDSEAPFQATEHLLQGSENAGGKSPIGELSESTNKRGNWLKLSAVATAIGVLLLGSSLIIEIWR